MVKVLGVEFAPLNIPLSRRLQTVAPFASLNNFSHPGFTSARAVFVSNDDVICVLSLWFFVYVFLFTKYWWLIPLYAAWFWYDYDTPKKGGRQLLTYYFRRWAIWRWQRDYFPVNLHKTEDLSPKKNYIFGYHPHGIVSVGAFTNFGTEANDVSNLFPNVKIHLCTLVGNFWFPLRREYTMFSGSIEVSKESIQWCLTRPEKGHAVVIVVGGAQEALDAHPGKYTITLKRRKGFIKMALKHGADLVPVFSFGENDVYLQLANPEGSTLRSLQGRMKTILGFSSPMFHGRGVFNYSLGMLPFRRPINTVVGRPIHVDQELDPTTDQMNALHEKYVQGLVDIFEENKKKFGIAEDIHLTIV